MLDRSIPPAIKDAIDYTYALPDINSRVSDNGVPIYYINSGSQDVIQVDWVFEGGLWHEQKPSVAQAFASILKNGTVAHTEKELSEAIEYYGANLRIMVNNDFTTVSLSALTKHLGNLLPIIHEIITQATFPQGELELYQQNAVQLLTVRLMNCDFVANRHIDAMVWGKAHPYGAYADVADIQALSRVDVIDYYHRLIHSKNCKIFVAGLYRDADIDQIHNYFGSNPWGHTAVGDMLVHYPIIASSVMSLRIDNDPDGKQASIRMSKQFVERTHPDFVPFQLLNTVLGGYFGSRLMTNIREEKGYTYGIYSYIGGFKHHSMLMISSEIGVDHIDATYHEICTEMHALQSTMVSDEELRLVKNYLLGGLLGDLDGPLSIMRFWKTIILNNMKREEFDHNIRIYKDTDAKRLMSLAQQYLDPESFYKVTVV